MNKNMPNTILYQPKPSKLCFFTNAIRSLITKKDTRKEVTEPAIKNQISVDVRLKPSSKKSRVSRAEAPSITGIARKNENSAAAVLDTPTVEAPRIVEPEREVPGTTERV